MWDWSWIQQEDSSDDSTNSSTVDSSNKSNESSTDLKSDNDNEDDASSIPAITHTVVFKCNGNTKEIRYQEVLALANKKRKEGMDVLVKLER